MMTLVLEQDYHSVKVFNQNTLHFNGGIHYIEYTYQGIHYIYEGIHFILTDEIEDTT